MEAPPAGQETQGESLEEMQARHRREKRELQGRVTGKKKGATKKTRRAVNDECAGMERRLAEKQEEEIASHLGTVRGPEEEEDEDGEEGADVNVGDGVADVVKGVGEVRLEEPPAVQAQAQVPGKKRNRQKERLARRQAERLAAAEAAENEASGMVDHRAVEREAMASTFEANSLVEREIRPDGHCLFSAVADQLQHRGISLSVPGLAGAAAAGGGGDEGAVVPGYKAVRGVAAGWIRDHGDDFAPFLEEDLGNYVAKMRDTAEWGGQVELQALAAAYNLEINVVQNGPTETIRAGDGEGGAEKIWLAYYRHGYGLGEHYNSLRTAPS